MIDINEFISNIPFDIPLGRYATPWGITTSLKEIIMGIIPQLGDQFIVENGAAIHKTAILENGVTIKGPVIIMENCQVSANAYFREGVLLGSAVKIGPGSEVKSSIICSGSAIAHLNYIGNSIIGENVNFEAGSIAANHYNERTDKRIWVKYNNKTIDTGVEKFGALVGDGSRIGANGVLSPGTILKKYAVVKRLELIAQLDGK
tara:strand:+ start:2532 stop:3143 length:612 start_codon:yes stop_codon:yes gene_type:complete